MSNFLTAVTHYSASVWNGRNCFSPLKQSGSSSGLISSPELSVASVTWHRLKTSTRQLHPSSLASAGASAVQYSLKN